METNELNYKKILNSNIILFLSYGILTGFIFILIAFIINNLISMSTIPLLSTSLSTISGIIIFYILRFVCRSSSIETFKKSKLASEYNNNFLKNMNLFFIICIIISIILCIGYLLVNYSIFSVSINNAYIKYGTVSPEIASKIITNIRAEYEQTITSRLISSIIIELSLVISFLSLIPYQKQLLEKFNKQ